MHRLLRLTSSSAAVVVTPNVDGVVTFTAGMRVAKITTPCYHDEANPKTACRVMT